MGVWGGYIKRTAAVNNNTWHHVAAILNDDGSPAVNETLLYIDGVLQAASANSSQAVNTIASQNVMIGAYKNAGIPGVYFVGLIVDVRMYDTPLTQEEISAAMQNQ